MKGLNRYTTAHAAAFGAAALIASQVAGKAVRDAFFLSHFAVSALPAMVVFSSVLSIVMGVAIARLTSVIGPRRLFPSAFMFSAILLLFEWGIAAWKPGVAAVLIYLQMAIIGSVLISGFWSLLGDRFDARSAKKQFSRIVAAGTFGGIVGGVLAERVGSSLGITSTLPILAFLHVLCALIAAGLSSGRPVIAKRSSSAPKANVMSGIGVLRTVPYVRNLALLILFSTMGAAFLDYAFKVRASAGYESGDQLVRFFALFYATVGVATFLVQLALSRVAVERLGVARTVGSLPLALAVGGVGGLVVPGIPMVSVMRGGEAMVRSSLFKSGYEMLYAAVPRRERRATKSILDVGVERLGDLLGALLLGAMSWFVSPPSTALVLALAAMLGAAGFWISRRLQRGYVQALENSLLSQSTSTPPGSKDLKTFGDLLRTFLSKGSSTKSERPVLQEAPGEYAIFRDPVVDGIRELRSGDAAAVRRVLAQVPPLTLAPHIIALLAWDEVSAQAIAALKKMGPKITGQLVDALLDPDQEFAIRRRIPRVLAEFDLQRAADGLIAGLSDTRFEVRFHSGRALAQIRERSENILMDQEAIIRAVGREFDISPEVWRHHRVLDATQEETEGAIAVEHIFRLLALVYPREPLQIAYRALRSQDDYMRRTSLEYLEQILPPGVWQHILALVEEPAELAVAANRGD